jgi:hypothetical protein
MKTGEPSDLPRREQAQARAFKALAGLSLTAFAPGPKWPELAKSRHSIGLFVPAAGAVAQLGERRNRTAEVRGSNPLGSTNNFNGLKEKRAFTATGRSD